jgi:hypothetical protein
MCNSVLFCDLQRPLTVKDYLKNSPISALMDIVTGVSVGAGAGAGTLRYTRGGAAGAANIVIVCP